MTLYSNIHNSIDNSTLYIACNENTCYTHRYKESVCISMVMLHQAHII